MAKFTQEQFEALQAELNAAKAQVDELKAQVSTKKTGGSRVRAGIPEDQMADPESNLGKVQRAERNTQIDAFPKIVRGLGDARACELIVSLSEELAAKLGKPHDEVLAEIMTRKARPAKGEKVVDDGTTQPEEAPAA